LERYYGKDYWKKDEWSVLKSVFLVKHLFNIHM
jgi:hypothetical protein